MRIKDRRECEDSRSSGVVDFDFRDFVEHRRARLWRRYAAVVGCGPSL
jgi:hypothetical protein